MPGLTVTVITKNEAHNLSAALGSVAWADEIVVVDSGSSDETTSIAKRFTPRVIEREFRGYGDQKNHAASLARHDWILSLDADERATPELRERIRGILKEDGPADGYSIPRRNIFWGAWVRRGGLYPDYQLRLFRRSAGRFVENAVHESVTVSGRVEALTEPLLHHSYRDLEDFVRRSNRYSTLSAQDWIRRGRRAGLLGLVTRPLGRFFSMYIVHRGFLDGWRGFVLAVLYAEYVFLRMAKVWETRRGRKPGEGD